MSPKLPVVRSKEVVRALEKAGYKVKRQTGSHVILHAPDSNYIITVPIHTGDIPQGTLRAIIRQAGMNVEAFIELLK